MIVAERKPLAEILERIAGAGRVLLVGCGACVTVCHAGGEKEVELLASQLRLAARRAGRELETVERTVERQCEPEFVEPLVEAARAADLVVSLACGVGVQLAGQILEGSRVLAALNTTFHGALVGEGRWEERCAGCGDCRLHLFQGLCPVARCAKNLLNGPCGGCSADGACEVDRDTPCVWAEIVERATRRGELAALAELVPPRDFRPGGGAGPRQLDRSDLRTESAGPEAR